VDRQVSVVVFLFLAQAQAHGGFEHAIHQQPTDCGPRHAAPGAAQTVQRPNAQHVVDLPLVLRQREHDDKDGARDGTHHQRPQRVHQVGTRAHRHQTGERAALYDTWLAQFKDLHLSEDEAKALIVVREAGALHNGTYRELTKVDTLTASQSLRRLRDAGFACGKNWGHRATPSAR